MRGGGTCGGFSRAFTPLERVWPDNPGLRRRLPGALLSRPFSPGGRAGSAVAKVMADTLETSGPKGRRAR